MKLRFFQAVFSLVMGLGVAVLLGIVVQGAEPRALGAPVPSTATTAPQITSTLPSAQAGPRDKYPARKQTLLLWPKRLSAFVQEYPSWDSWLGSRSDSPYSVRDELLVLVRAIAAKIPDLEIATDEPQSDLILVSGNPAVLSILLDQLRDYPLLASFTDDIPAERAKARSIWRESNQEAPSAAAQGSIRPRVNIGITRARNVVWGYGAPGTAIQVRLTRSDSHVLTATTTVDADGLYHVYLAWDVQADDVVEVGIGDETRRVLVLQRDFALLRDFESDYEISPKFAF